MPILHQTETNDVDKVLEEKSPKGLRESERGSARNVHGLFTSNKNQNRNSFPPYDAMGSEKNSDRDRQSQDKNVLKNEIINMNESKSDIGFNPAIENIDNSRNVEE